MPSPTIDRHRNIANGAGGDVRLAMETVAEIMKYREALYRAAPSFQGGHSVDGRAIADALGLTFPIRVPELEAKAKDEGLDTNVLWPWIYKQRAAERRFEPRDEDEAAELMDNGRNTGGGKMRR